MNLGSAMISSLAAALIGLCACTAWALPGDGRVTAHIAARKDTVAVFLPPPMQSERSDQAKRSRELVKAAMRSTRRCLGSGEASYVLVFAQRIVVDWDDRSESFDVSDADPLVGALLIRPGSNARLFYAPGGPESLAQTLPLAASDYFGRRCRG